MNSMRVTSHSFIRSLGVSSAIATLMMASSTPGVFAQSQSGFTYNGLNFISYQANEFLSSSSAASSIRATGANYTAVMATQYQQTSTSNVIAPETPSTPGYNSSRDPLSPTDAAVVSAIRSLQAQGLVVSMKPQVDSLDGVFRGNFAPTNPTAWFASYQTFILHYAQIAVQNNVGMLVIGTEFKSLSGAAYKSNWETIITQLRIQYPSLTLTYASNATGAGDEFTSVSFWADLDIIGVDGYFPLTNQTDPSLAALISAWTNNKSGFNIVSALKNLQSTYNKPLIFTEIGYVSAPGTNETPYASLGGTYDPTEQQDCYEAFFQVFSAQTAWMKGVFWWDWRVSAPSANDTGYSTQNKPAGTITLPKWYGSTIAGFTIAPAKSTLPVGQGLSTTDVISVTTQGGFSGAVTLDVSGLPSGVTASFANSTVAGSQVLTLTASSFAATAGPIPVTVTGTFGSITATTSIALTVGSPTAQTITFANSGAQTLGTTLSLNATASSGLPVTFTSSTASVCSVNNSAATASLIAAGTCTLTASQAGNGTYSAATAVTNSFTVSTLPPVPVPANARMLVSQVNWRASLGGYAYASGNPAGSSFAVNSNGSIAVANSSNLVLFNAQTGAATTLGPWASASALTVDSKDNIYVGNPYGPVNSIVKLPYIGGAANGGYAAFTTPTASIAVCTAASTTECVLPTNLGAVNPASLAFDAKGDLFYATAGDGSSGGNSIYECNLTCLGGTGAPVLIFTEPKVSPAPSLSSGQPLVGPISFDSAGNLFFADSAIYVNLGTYAITSFSSNLNELPITAGTGFNGVATGYVSSPTVLYTVTPSPVGTFDNQLDGVAVLRSASGDTVYFADQSDGIFAFPDTLGGIPVAGGKPTALYAVSPQGAKTLALDTQGNLYLASYSNSLGTAGDTVAQVTVNSVTVPASTVGRAISPSTTTSQVTSLLNDTNCGGSPAPSLAFVASTSAMATATVIPSVSCTSTLSGGASFTTTVSFTPTLAGPDSLSLTGTDQAGSTASILVSGVGSGFTLSFSSSSLTVAQGASTTSTITVTNQGAFAGSVTLSASGLPAGVTASFSPNPSITGTSVLTLTSAATAGTGGPTSVTITGTSGSVTQTTTIAVTVNTAPSFTLSPSPATLAVLQGSTGNSTISVVAFGGFTGSVTLSAIGLPSGVTAAFATNPATGSSLLTFTANSAAAVGTSTITINAISGTLSASTSIALTVNGAPSFTLASSAPSLSLVQGASGTATVTVTAAYGFTGPVTLASTGLPTGVTATFGTNPATGTSVVTFTASATAAVGTATTNITGTSGNLTAATSIALTVSLQPSFNLAPASASVSIVQGTSVTDSITITGANGFAGGVNLAATGLPNGVTASFSTNPASASTTLTLSASAAASAGGAVPVTVTGTAGTLTNSIIIALTVNVPPSFTLVAAPATLTIAQASSATSTITVTSLGGFNGTVALAANGLPAGVTASFTVGTVAGTQVLTLTAAGTATIGGPANITITGTSGTLSTTTGVSFSVVATPGFAFSGNNITVHHGDVIGNTSVISISPTNGFTGTVALNCAVTPAAANSQATCTLSPSAVSFIGTTAQTSTLTIFTTAGSLAENRGSRLFLTSAAGSVLAFVMFVGVPRRRNWPGFLTMLLSIGVALGFAGCGSSAPNSSTVAPGTTPGSYTVTVTGTSGATTANGTISLTVQ